MNKIDETANALEALSELDDCARMDIGVDAMGPRKVLEQFIANVEQAHNDCYSAANFNQLCQDFDRLNEKYLALKKACDEAEPVAWKDTCVTTDENDVVSREPVLLGYEGWEMLTDGAGLFTHTAPVIASEQKPTCYQYQDRDGNWKPFIDEQHQRLTIESGAWNIRELFTSPPNTAEIEQRVAEAICTLIAQQEKTYGLDCRTGDLYKATACEFLLKRIKDSQWRGYL